MILPFSTKFPNGKPTYFIDKIWDGFINDMFLNIIVYQQFKKQFFEKFNTSWDSKDSINPKRHTIRVDAHDRWKAGMKIHFVINNRSKNFFQFAPVIECKSVQTIDIEYLYEFAKDPLLPAPVSIEVDERSLDASEVEILAKNDGFDSVDDFFNWFNTDFTGKIIHWTDLKY